MSTHSPTVRLARWSATHAWPSIGLWLLFVVACFAVGGAAGLATPSAASSGVGDSGRAASRQDDAGLTPPAVEGVLIGAPEGGRFDPAAARAAAADLTRRLRGLPEVSSVDAPVTAPDGGVLLVRAEMAGDADDAAGKVAPLLAATAAVQQAHPDLRIEEAGAASSTDALNDAVAKDFRTAELSTVPATLLILLLAFGALTAAGIPVLFGLTAVAAASGLTMLVSHLIPTNAVVNTIILLIGLAVAVDYSLFYLRRDREERRNGRDKVDAVEIAAATSGHAVVTSGVAVAIAMASLYLVGDPTFTSVATGAIVVIAVSVLGSLTVLPAVLVKLGRFVDRPRVPLLWRLADRRGEPRIWPAILRPTLRHPLAALLVSAAVLVGLALPALGLKLQQPGQQDLPRDLAVVQSLDRMTAAFPSTGTAYDVVVKAAPEQADAVRAALAGLARTAAGDRLFAADPAAPSRTSADRTVHTLAVAVPYEGRSAQAEQALTRLRADLVPAALATVPGAESAVGGQVAADIDYSRNVGAKLPWVIGFVLLCTFVMMVLSFGSPVVAAKAIVLNALSVGAAYGVLVAVFQGDWAGDVLGFRSTHAIVPWIPAFLFVVLFGLSMDYHVFVVSRIREYAGQGLDTREAVTRGISATAGVVTSAGAVMIAVFSIVGTLSVIDMKQIGVGLAVAILLDVTVVRAVMLPAAMVLLGRANWWAPEFLRRRATPAPAVGEPAPVPVAVRVA